MSAAPFLNIFSTHLPIDMIVMFLSTLGFLVITDKDSILMINFIMAVECFNPCAKSVAIQFNTCGRRRQK